MIQGIIANGADLAGILCNGKKFACAHKPDSLDKDPHIGVGSCKPAFLSLIHIFKVRDDVPLCHAAFLEPVATVVEGIERLRLSPGENVLVIGAGTMGNLNAQVAARYGASVIISEVSDKKLETLKQMGFRSLINPSRENMKERLEEILKGDALDAIIVSVGAVSYTHLLLTTEKKEKRAGYV